MATTDKIISLFSGEGFFADEFDTFLAIEGGGTGGVLVFIIVVDQGGKSGFEVFGLAGNGTEATFGEALEGGGVVWGISGNFSLFFFRDETESFKALGGGINSGTAFVDSSGDLGRGALALFDEIEVDFGLGFGEADLL